MLTNINWLDILKFDIDMLEITLPVPYNIDTWFISLDDFILDDDNASLLPSYQMPKNSNVLFRTFFWLDFWVIHYNITNFEIYQFSYQDVPLFSFNIWLFKNQIDTSRFVIYWEFFNFYTQEKIDFSPLEFIESYISPYITRIMPYFERVGDYLEVSSRVIIPSSLDSTYLRFYKHKNFFQIKRMDIALDLKSKKSETLNMLDITQKLYSFPQDDIDEPELNSSYSIWNYLRDENRIEYLRIYNKKQDLWKSTKKAKWKAKLYPNYANIEYIQRIELELRQDLCVRLPFDSLDYLKDKNKLWQLFCHRMSTYSKTFQKQDLSLTPTIKNKTPEFPYNSCIPTDYNSRLQWYLKKIYNDLSYFWLCEAVLNPNFQNQKFIRTESLKFKKLWCVSTQIDYIKYLDSLIKYWKNSLKYPSSKINKCLKNNLSRHSMTPFPNNQTTPLFPM